MKIVHEHFVIDLKSEEYKTLLEEFGKNKVLPSGFEGQAIQALSYYPELKDIYVEFVVKKALFPLSCRPRPFSLVNKRKNRKYIIVISSGSLKQLEQILLKNLPYNAQVGVLGHELAHVADYINRGTWSILSILPSFLIRKKMDAFEWATDMRAIDHGLGYQLLAWSIATRKAMSVYYKEGRTKMDTRYMPPDAIRKVLAHHPLYANTQ